MSLLDEIMEKNNEFVTTGKYKAFQTTKYPRKKMVILSCMDTRLVELLPKAMDLKNGDFKLIKNAGAVINQPFGSVMRSILVAVYQLQAEEVFVIGHHQCGMSNVNTYQLLNKMKERGVKEETLEVIENCGIKLHKWLRGFDNVEDSVRHSVNMIKNHPLTPTDIFIHGLIIDPVTGKLDIVVNGYETVETV